MPLTARLAGYRDPLDASQRDLGVGLGWDVVRGGDPRPDLRCPVCDGGMHARESQLGARFFAHNPYQGHERCPYRGRGETEEHVLLKRAIARAVRDAGWRASVEHAELGWRADVLAQNPRGSWRMAWEVQLSGSLREDLSDRTARYAADGVRVCWVTTRSRAPWFGTLPSLLLEEHTSKKGNDLWMATRGYAVLATKPLARIHAVKHNSPARRMVDLVGERTLAWDRRHRRDGGGPAAPWRTLLPEGISYTEAEEVATDPFRALIGWFTKRVPLFKFVDDLQHARLAPVELAPPHRLVGRTVENGARITWIPIDLIPRAKVLTCFAYGWAAEHDAEPMPCCADSVDASDEDTHRIALSNHITRADLPLCVHCDPLAPVLRDITDFEFQNYAQLPMRVGWQRPVPTLVHDRPAKEPEEFDT
ncbi:competence protein CoiA family protein [Amycolatopsis taiwanensis]|uniref:Competence protein CoiA nuclease-like domain-containing protein n=1 Tax=Amycolatopsis taiwanensis TaxID=342230 RepID=A0A9W6VF79_9PSEU|nr:competence protein CoiA family protein [Amycolatopsis taiwanensis]GLY66530.1 hypothetical protein Atai01_31490 [Amycolatopsis taiwanensis]